MAVFVEKTIASPPNNKMVYWHDEKNVFVDPRFTALKIIRDRTNWYIIKMIKGGITANTLRNLFRHYLPFLSLPSSDKLNNRFDITFYCNPERDQLGPF